MAYIIATDIGTTHCKVITVNESGKTIQTFRSEIQSAHPEEGFHEQNVETIFKTVLDLLIQTTKKIDRKSIKAFSFSAAMHSLLAVDKNGTPISMAMTWADMRSKKYAQQLRTTPDGRVIYGQTGTPIHAMSPLCKILYLKHEKPELYNAAYKFISIKEYIFFRLFGKYVVDVGIASSTGMYDIFNNCWNAEALRIAGIDASQLSVVVPAVHIETALLPLIRRSLNIPEEIPFVIGGNDGCLANLGCGALRNNEAALTIGTSGAIRVATPKPRYAQTDGLFRYLLTNDIYITGGPINNGGIALKWFAENVLQMNISTNDDIVTVLKIAEQAPAGSGGICFIPYLLGERAPVWNEDATGMFYGLKIHHTKEHLTRAVVEGISFSLLMISEAIELANDKIDDIYASGIVVRSDWWLQMIADMFGKRVLLNDATDASAMGAAFMAMYATGMITDLTQVRSFLRPYKTFSPVPRTRDTYQSQFECFKSLIRMQTR